MSLKSLKKKLMKWGCIKHLDKHTKDFTHSFPYNPDTFDNILANASSVLFSKTHEYEHNGTLMRNPIGYFTNTFKNMMYHYIDSFKAIHNVATRKEHAHTGNLSVFKQIIAG